MPEISVIVPVYKTPKEYLDKCVESIVGQTVKDIELILIDDGSPDECGKYCDEYAKIDSRIKVIHQKNSGVSAARNAGIEAAQGNWIAFVDSDDWLDENAFEYALKYADGNDMVIWCTYLEEENKTLEG